MRDDPLQGDVIPLKGRQWQGRYRFITMSLFAVVYSLQQHKQQQFSQRILVEAAIALCHTKTPDSGPGR